MPYIDIQPLSLTQVVIALLAVCAIIVLAGGAGSVIIRIGNPFRAINKRLDAHENRLKGHDDKLVNDLERFQNSAETDTMVLVVLDALLEHARTNNATGKMDATAQELRTFLICRKQNTD